MYVKENKLCFEFLNVNIIAKDCKLMRRCKEYKKLHPTSLHDSYWVQANAGPPSDQPAESYPAKVACGNKASMVVPVFISHSDQPDKELKWCMRYRTHSPIRCLFRNTPVAIKASTVQRHYFYYRRYQ